MIKINQNTQWIGLSYTERYKYLGIIIGINITRADIFRAPLDKFTKRINAYMHLRYSFSITKKIVIANVFLVAIFSYHFSFCYIDGESLNQIEALLWCFLRAPHNYFSLSSLYAPTGLLGYQQPLRNPWFVNIASLARQAEDREIDDIPLFDNVGCHSLLTDELIQDARELIEAPDPRGYNMPIPSLPAPQADLYQLLLNSQYNHNEVTSYLSKRLRYFNIDDPADIELVCTNTANLKTAKCPPFLTAFQIRLALNGLPTARRLTPIANNEPKRSPYLYGRQPCFLCQSVSSSDAQQHIYSSECDVSRTAWVLVRALLMPSLSASPGIHDFLLARPYTPKECLIVAFLSFHLWMRRCRHLEAPPSLDSREVAKSIFYEVYTSAQKVDPTLTLALAL